MDVLVGAGAERAVARARQRDAEPLAVEFGAHELLLNNNNNKNESTVNSD